MLGLDFNCFIGGWPFHMVRVNTLAKLRAVHERNGIAGGYVSSTDAIFWNDPLEADRKLKDILRGQTTYRHVQTINPALPGMLEAIEIGAQELGVKGVRILPGFHGYCLLDKKVEELCNALRRYRLPVFITARGEDERVTHMFHPQSVPLWDIAAFLGIHRDIPVVLCNMRRNELEWLGDLIRERDNVFFDCSGLKDGLYPIDSLAEAGYIEHALYGSFAPLFCLKSSLLFIEEAKISEEQKLNIISGKRFLNILSEYQDLSQENLPRVGSII